MIHLVKLYSDEGQTLEDIQKQLKQEELKGDSRTSSAVSNLSKSRRGTNLVSKLQKKLTHITEKMKNREKQAYKIAKANEKLFIEKRAILIRRMPMDFTTTES